MPNFIEHIAGKYESGVQRCVICGFLIIDDRHMIGPSGQPESKGYEPGPVQVSDGNPQITTAADMSERYSVKKCSEQ